MVRFIGGHLETVKSMLRLAEQGKVELHTPPKRMEALLIEAQGQGINSLESDTGVGSFLDPRVGRGAAVVPGRGRSLVEAAGRRLRYHLPKLDVALFIAPAADVEDNIHIHNRALYTESYEASLAAKANGGKAPVTEAAIATGDGIKLRWPKEREIVRLAN